MYYSRCDMMKRWSTKSRGKERKDGEISSGEFWTVGLAHHELGVLVVG